MQYKSDQVDGQNVVLEMYLVSLKDTTDWAKGTQLRAMLISMLQAIILPIWLAYKSDEQGLNDWKYTLFRTLLTIVCFMFYTANQILLIGAIQIYRFKYEYQLQIQSILDLKEAYFNETKT